MRAVVQRVRQASVSVRGRTIGAIGKGLLAYVGVEEGDGGADLDYVSSKLMNMRLFDDGEGRMNLDIKQAEGSFLIISQFTLLGDLRKGRRPSFDRAEGPDKAKGLYLELIKVLKEKGMRVEAGEFQAHMEVESVNDGPVTVLLESRKIF